jgi:ABC-2 type transport system ATP-binding protein
MTIMIESSELSKRFAGLKKPALQDVQLSVPAGSLYGLVGPDGAGKTTLLRIISGVMPPSSGSVKIAGYDVQKEAARIRPLMGYMPQEFSQYPDLSLEENLDFFAQIQRVPLDKKAERIRFLLEFTQLAPFAKRRAGKLSGGMKKKLALACAMVHSPRLLILDEPSTGVDPLSRRELWALLGQVVQEGVTVLLSTPYMDEAERCSNVGMLFEGHLMVSGAPGEITAKLPFEILEVKARPRKLMRAVVDATEGIMDWYPVGDRLRVATKGNGSQPIVQERLSAAFKESNAALQTLRPARKTMEDAFVHFVREEGGKNG